MYRELEQHLSDLDLEGSQGRSGAMTVSRGRGGGARGWCLAAGTLLVTVGLLCLALISISGHMQPAVVPTNVADVDFGDSVYVQLQQATASLSDKPARREEGVQQQQEQVWTHEHRQPPSHTGQHSAVFVQADKAPVSLRHLTALSPPPSPLPAAEALDDDEDGDGVYPGKLDDYDYVDQQAPLTNDADVIYEDKDVSEESDGAGVKVERPGGGGKAVRRLPQAIIIGVKKGGTRALLEFLRIHPDVRAPGPEPHYFDKNYDRDLTWYRRQMPTSFAGQLTMEKTPSYFVTRDVPARIYNMSRDMRLVVVVRDPVTRAVSDYAQAVAKRPDLPPFHRLAFVNSSSSSSSSSRDPYSDDVINTSWGPIRIGLYARHLERWLKYFPLSQMHFVSGERLIEDPAAELALVQDFLGLKRVVGDKHFYFNATKGFPCLKKTESSRGAPRCLGTSKGRPHPYIDSDVIARLRHFYRPHNRLFYSMTGLDFGWQ